MKCVLRTKLNGSCWSEMRLIHTFWPVLLYFFYPATFSFTRCFYEIYTHSLSIPRPRNSRRFLVKRYCRQNFIVDLPKVHNILLLLKKTFHFLHQVLSPAAMASERAAYLSVASKPVSYIVVFVCAVCCNFRSRC